MCAGFSRQLDFAVFGLGNAPFDNRVRAVRDFNGVRVFKNQVPAIANGWIEFDFPAVRRGSSVAGDAPRAKIYLVARGKIWRGI